MTGEWRLTPEFSLQDFSVDQYFLKCRWLKLGICKLILHCMSTILSVFIVIHFILFIRKKELKPIKIMTDLMFIITYVEKWIEWKIQVIIQVLCRDGKNSEGRL